MALTAAQRRLRELLDRQARDRGRMAEPAYADSLADEIRAELSRIEQCTPNQEWQIKAARGAAHAEGETRAVVLDCGRRGRIELRSKTSLTAVL